MAEPAGEFILVVDDDEQVRGVLERVLTRAGYYCMLAEDAQTARELMDEHDFDLAILDVMLPSDDDFAKTGLSLLAHIHFERPLTAVIMLTGRDDHELASLAFRYGAYGYIIKPFTANEVLINIANGLQRRRLQIDARVQRLELEEQIRRLTEELAAHREPRRDETTAPAR